MFFVAENKICFYTKLFMLVFACREFSEVCDYAMANFVAYTFNVLRKRSPKTNHTSG